MIPFIRNWAQIWRLFNVDSVANGDVFVYNSSTKKFEKKTVTQALAGKIVYNAIYTTTGGATSEVITASGLLATDVVVATLHTPGGTPTTLSYAFCDAGEINLEFAADPSNDHKINIVVIRP